MIKRIKQLNEALPMLLVGIVVWGILVQFSVVWFVDDKLRYSVGVWVGVACAIFMAVHLALVIENAVDNGTSEKRLKFKSVIRYLIIVVVFLIMAYFNLGNVITAFIALLGLKVSAYAQPLIYKLIHKNQKEEEVKL